VGDLKGLELLDRRYDRLQSYGRFTDTRVASR
jgi:acetyl-CoA carboxylase carboxyl transferase subunit alpha